MEKHELVDELGNKTGRILTNEEVCHIENIPKGYYVSVAGVVIMNNRNEVLLQKRSENKAVNPGKWEICGGKLNVGENFINAAIRETSEEIGILLNKEKLKPLCKGKRGKAYFAIYLTKNNLDINKCKIQKEELDEIKYFNINEIEKLEKEGFEWLESLKKFIKAEREEER